MFIPDNLAASILLPHAYICVPSFVLERIKPNIPVNKNIIITENGTSKTFPFPIYLKAFGKPLTGIPLVITRANPLTILILPKVTTNGGKSPKTISNPFIRPDIIPVINPNIIAIIIGTPLTKARDVTIPAIAIFDPIDKSIPVVISTKV